MFARENKSLESVTSEKLCEMFTCLIVTPLVQYDGNVSRIFIFTSHVACLFRNKGICACTHMSQACPSVSLFLHNHSAMLVKKLRKKIVCPEERLFVLVVN